MKESFLHWVWQQRLIATQNLILTNGESLVITHVGTLNNIQGPDFSNALLEINHQKWAGNVEIHIKSSDWYAHQHQKDENYKNVILHVVYEHDVEVYDEHNNEIPTLELKSLIPENLIQNFTSLMLKRQQWIFCEDQLKTVDSFLIENWLERVYVERLERKVKEIELVFERSGKDWEATLFLTLSKYFGGNLNGDYFLNAFSKVDFSIIRKQMVNKTLDAFLFGLLGLVNEEVIEDAYYLGLKKEFSYQKQKFQLEEFPKYSLNFYGCRPSNFPTIRLAQLIALYQKKNTLFAYVLELGADLNSYKDLLSVEVDSYWQAHYNFGKTSKKSPKRLSKNFGDLLLINAIVPVLFLHAQLKGEDNYHLLELMYTINAEKNGIVNKFKDIGVKASSALQSQALLTLKKEYCEKERCAECVVGVKCIER